MGIVGRKKLVRGERVVDAIRDASRPFVTTSDIAEHLDVSAQAVRDNAADLSQHDEIEKGKVGQNSVYWLAERESPPERVTPDTEPPEPPEPPTRENADSLDEQEQQERGILDRFMLPKFGSPFHIWALATATALLGLVLGVMIGFLVIQPPLGVAYLAVTFVLGLAVAVTLPTALYYSLSHAQEVTEETA